MARSVYQGKDHPWKCLTFPPPPQPSTACQPYIATSQTAHLTDMFPSWLHTGVLRQLFPTKSQGNIYSFKWCLFCLVYKALLTIRARNNNYIYIYIYCFRRIYFCKWIIKNYLFKCGIAGCNSFLCEICPGKKYWVKLWTTQVSV